METTGFWALYKLCATIIAMCVALYAFISSNENEEETA